MEPVEGLVRGARHVIRDAGLARAPAPRQDGQQTRLAGRSVPARRLARVGTAPVDDLVVAVAHGRERIRAPAQDPLVDLEPAPDRARGRTARLIDDGVAGERLADRLDVAHRDRGPAAAGAVACRIAQMGDDHVADRPVAAEINRPRAVDEDPARVRAVHRERERQAPKHLVAGGQAGERRAVQGVQAPGELRIGCVADRRQIDRLRSRAGSHQSRLRCCARPRGVDGQA